MTNEEKAQEICEKHKRYNVECSSLECYMSALEMARWKEQQMIEKAVSFLNENLMRTLLFDKQDKENFINNFKKAMEEQL